jgi:DNA invertase Pin-like site-specific DNA recombinase
MTNVIGYARVSTQEQSINGVSLDAQIDKIKAYATLYEIDLVEVVVDAGVSAKTLKRDGLSKVLMALDNGDADAVIIFKLDRLTRSICDWNYLIDKYFGKFALLSVSDQIDTRTAAGRLCLNVLMSVAQWEREVISERTSTALQYKKSQGHHVGSPALGFQMIDKSLEKIESELETIARIEKLKKDGFKLQQIADQLNLQNIPTKRGGKWYPTTIKNVLEKIA